MNNGNGLGAARTIALLLCDVRSAHNVGTMFRTADAAGVSEIVLGGYTPTPIDRFGRKRSDIAKAALGAEESVPWRQEADFLETVMGFRSRGYAIVALEQTPASIVYKDHVPPGPTLLVVGNEIEGVPAAVTDCADVCIMLPMSGAKESLNVAVATGIALFHLRDAQGLSQ